MRAKDVFVTLQALLFDVDGTVADTETCGHLPAYNQAFAALGESIHWSIAEYQVLLQQSSGLQRLIHYAQTQGDAFCLKQTNIHDWAKSVHALKSEIFRARIQAGQVPLRPGVARLMLSAKTAGLKVALVSNASTPSLNAVLEGLLPASLVKQLDAVIGGESGARRKPAPDLYLKALEMLNIAPENALAIEDSEMGLHAALAANIQTLVTYNKFTAHEDFTGALGVIDHLGEPWLPMGNQKWQAQNQSLSALSVTHITLDLIKNFY